MQLLEEKRKQYFELLTLIEEWDDNRDSSETADKVFASITRMYFIASMVHLLAYRSMTCAAVAAVSVVTSARSLPEAGRSRISTT